MNSQKAVNKRKQEKAKTKVVVESDDLADIFSKIKEKKTDKKNDEMKRTTSAKKTHAGEEPLRPKRDGLFRKKEMTMELSNNDFFRTRGESKAHLVDSSSSTMDAIKAREGVDTIVSMSELKKMLSHNPRAGTTPNCPFDCDCCF